MLSNVMDASQALDIGQNREAMSPEPLPSAILGTLTIAERDEESLFGQKNLSSGTSRVEDKCARLLEKLKPMNT